ACPAVRRDAAAAELAREAACGRLVRKGSHEQAVGRGVSGAAVQQGAGAPAELAVGETQAGAVRTGRDLYPGAAWIGLGQRLPARRRRLGLAHRRAADRLAADWRGDILDRIGDFASFLVLQRAHGGLDRVEAGLRLRLDDRGAAERTALRHQGETGA